MRSGYGLTNPSSMEAWVVRISDSLAYLNHDIDDALRAGLLDADEMPEDMRALITMRNSRRIDGMITDVVANSTPEAIGFSADMLGEIERLRSFCTSMSTRGRTRLSRSRALSMSLRRFQQAHGEQRRLGARGGRYDFGHDGPLRAAHVPEELRAASVAEGDGFYEVSQ